MSERNNLRRKLTISKRMHTLKNIENKKILKIGNKGLCHTILANVVRYELVLMCSRSYCLGKRESEIVFISCPPEIIST